MSEAQFRKRPALGATGRLDRAFYRRLLSSDPQTYYSAPELNDALYLHYLGVERIEGLEPFTALRALYLEGNAITRIEGLQELERLRCLCLQDNFIERMENLQALEELNSLNLCGNRIMRVEGLERNTRLEMLQLRGNRIGAGGLDDLRGLTRCKRLSSLDLVGNRIDAEEPEQLIAILEQLPALAVLYLQGNPICARIPDYRKTLISRLKRLQYLDDRPVFPEDRRFADAFRAGGLAAELEERGRHKEEERERHLERHLAFKAMLEGRASREETAESDNSEHSSQLEAYISDGEETRGAATPTNGLLDDLD